MAKILVVDDDQGMREVLEIMLERDGYEVGSVSNPERALRRLRRERYDLIITDLRMPGMDGIQFLRQVKELDPDQTVILLTAFASPDTALAAMKEGAYDYIEKNFDVEELKNTIRQALEKKGIKREETFARDGGEVVHFGGMISKSRKMISVFQTIMKVAETTTNVLILGESGTGKELVARAIHEKSKRSKMPFVVINCGGVPENLLESEFFGYTKGAFTGAFNDRAGLFEIADGGTIFLDEIGELSPFLQVKLLRVVQDKTFRRIGGSEDIKVDVRIISATNQDLRRRVQEGTFREDLYFRLNVIPIHLPPLRERREDIPVLTSYFIERYCRAFGKEPKTLSAYTMDLLMRYDFPGNVRELENIVERGVALEETNIILPENLSVAPPSGTILDGVPEGGLDLNAELARYERVLIEDALGKTGGSRAKAAKMLGISADSLYYRMEKLGITQKMS
ncbi:MAG TPA: sigma-54 dependent transcriptional regulator [Syntrophales bacterium]|nr:sigma-54 dependent transcriptional regulator [Syntrophales bacterium]HON98881.1 sigma-54 dependent transcriptional regulator [Syntrophales bacterium]HPC00345.1 sigma-54 dependent transcriptional regulator [Syntrophales bacterium]HRV42092.1 sigma-54 dependent transcriptional regulator [Syntrophales bacterium]